MARPKLTMQQALDAERWYQEYERVGTFNDKARSLGVTKDTLLDSIRRVRGEDTRPLAKKLAAYSAALRSKPVDSHVSRETDALPIDEQENNTHKTG